MFTSIIKRTLLSLMALVLLTTGSFAALSLVSSNKASAAPVGYYYMGKLGHGNYAAHVGACKETVNTPYGILYQVNVFAVGPADTAGNWLQFSVVREGRHVAGVQSNAWTYNDYFKTNATQVSGLISPYNGDGFRILLGQPGSSSGSSTFLPYYLQNCY